MGYGSAFLALIAEYKSVRELHLNYREMRLDNAPGNSRSTVLRNVLNCTNLTKLKLQNGFTLDDVVGQQIVDRCKSIRSLSLGMNNK